MRWVLLTLWYTWLGPKGPNHVTVITGALSWSRAGKMAAPALEPQPPLQHYWKDLHEKAGNGNQAGLGNADFPTELTFIVVSETS